MLAMSDLSLMVKAGVQWGLFGGAIENLGTEDHHAEFLRPMIDLELLGCFAMTETGHGSDVQSLETTATYDAATDEFVVHSPTRRRARTTSAARPSTPAWRRCSRSWWSGTSRTACTACWCRSATPTATTCPG